MKAFIRLLYERCPEVCYTRRWQALAYRDWERRQLVMVIWPFHYAVQLFHWIGYQWDRYRHRPSWIDRGAKRATAKQEAWEIVEPTLCFLAEAESLPKSGWETIRRALKHSRDNNE